MSATKPISPAFAFGQAVAPDDNWPPDRAPSIVPELPLSKGYLLPDGDVIQFEDQSQAAAKADPSR